MGLVKCREGKRSEVPGRPARPGEPGWTAGAPLAASEARPRPSPFTNFPGAKPLKYMALIPKAWWNRTGITMDITRLFADKCFGAKDLTGEGSHAMSALSIAPYIGPVPAFTGPERALLRQSGN